MEREAIDIRVAKFGKKIDKVQMVAGAGLMLFASTFSIGLGLLAFGAGENYVKNKYIDWRTGKNKTKQVRSSHPMTV